MNTQLFGAAFGLVLCVMVATITAFGFGSPNWDPDDLANYYCVLWSVGNGSVTLCCVLLTVLGYANQAVRNS